MIQAAARVWPGLGFEPLCPRGGDEGRGLARQLLRAQERERQRIAADLHDDIGQQLAAIKFSLDDALHGLAGRLDDAERRMLEAIAGRVVEAIDQTRRIAMDLRPPMLDDLGLTHAIAWFCGELRGVRKNLALRHEIRAQEEDVPKDTKIAVFRIVQEACNNACRHAGATELTVRLESDAEGLRLLVADNGVGFDPREVHGTGRGFGLRGMCERAQLSGGRVQILSRPGDGTQILADWPLTAG